jgi:hypothetical protein
VKLENVFRRIHPVDVELQQISRRVAGTAGGFRLDASEAGCREVETIDKGFDEPDGIFCGKVKVNHVQYSYPNTVVWDEVGGISRAIYPLDVTASSYNIRFIVIALINGRSVELANQDPIEVMDAGEQEYEVFGVTRSSSGTQHTSRRQRPVVVQFKIAPK